MFSKELNPIPAGGCQFAPPCSYFLHNSKSIGLRLLKFSDFSYIPKALSLGLKPGFNTNCISWFSSTPAEIGLTLNCFFQLFS